MPPDSGYNQIILENCEEIVSTQKATELNTELNITVTLSQSLLKFLDVHPFSIHLNTNIVWKLRVLISVLNI